MHSMVQYDVVCRHDVQKVLNNMPEAEAHRVKDCIKSVASNRKPTDHSKCELMQNDQQETIYKIRVGDYRALAQLERPEFRVLKVSRRQGAYRDIDDVYASL